MIELDLSWLNPFIEQIQQDFAGAPPLEIMFLIFFKYYGWVLFLIMIIWMIYQEYLDYISARWAKKNVNPILLAIDVPKRNEQSVKAMENLFDHLQGAHGSLTWWDKYVEGAFQLGFSCELVSIEGSIQFIIRTPEKMRNLVEAAVYSQFPEAEITEVEDYVNTVPSNYPNETHDMWGCEFTLQNKNVYLPIKSWLDFEHNFAEAFVDPMAALLETMSSIGPGENIWIQILIKPLGHDWGYEKGTKEINKIAGIKEEAKPPGIISKLTYGLLDKVWQVSVEAVDTVFGIEGGEGAGGEDKGKDDLPSMMMHLPSGKKAQIEAIERKISKWAWNTKIRFVYVAEKDKMNKAIGIQGIMGAVKQWQDKNLNGLKPDMAGTAVSSAHYILIDYRRNKRKTNIMTAYKARDGILGTPPVPMTGEELASFWHFPSMDLKAPLLKTTNFTKVAAPGNLPGGANFEPSAPASSEQKTSEEDFAEEKTADQPTFDYDSDTFEEQFAKDKKSFKKSRPARKKQLDKVAKTEKQKTAEKSATKPDAKKKTSKSKPPTITEKKKAAPGNLPFIDLD